MSCSRHRHDVGRFRRGLEHAAPYVFLALVAATLFGVMAGAGTPAVHWRCTDVRGGRVSDAGLDGGVWTGDLPRSRVTQTPAGWVIGTEHLGVLTAAECQEVP